MTFTPTIISWYLKHKRNLPWRKTTNPYFIWLSEIILQQTQVKQGLPYYLAFIKAYPTVFDLAAANEADILKLWQGLGYYSRARNLHFTAKTIVSTYNGVFPNTYKQLLTLKGVGDYTASAIASIAFNQVTAVVDGNVYRVLARYYGIKTPINSTEGIKTFKALATDLIDAKQPATFNQAIMEFGAIQCKPKTPHCTTCPLHTSCTAFKNNSITTLPVKLKKGKITKKYFNFLVYMDAKNNTVIEQRTTKGIWQNLYQFPLVETKSSVSIQQFESLNLPYKALDYYLYNEKDIIHKLSHQHLHTKFWIITSHALPETKIKASTIKTYAVPILIANFLDKFKF